MKYNKNDLVKTPRGKGIVEVPMPDTCFVRLSPKVNPTILKPCEFAIFDNNEIEKVVE